MNLGLGKPGTGTCEGIEISRNNRFQPRKNLNGKQDECIYSDFGDFSTARKNDVQFLRVFQTERF